MNKLWDDLKDNMKEWGASAVEKAEEISRVAVAKGEEFTKISKLKIDIIQLQKEKSKCYEKLGKLAYHNTNDDNMANFTGHADFFGLVKKVNDLDRDIIDKDKKIIEIKKVYGIDDDKDIDSNEYYPDENGSSEEE
tara:strand:+ start:733 stop:1140 length:408 start_codon:yes stop_codon:yes gene_type:complete